MYPDSVVEYLDIFENDAPCLRTGFKHAVVYQFDLKLKRDTNEPNRADGQNSAPVEFSQYIN
jgi:hypothetical protein